MYEGVLNSIINPQTSNSGSSIPEKKKPEVTLRGSLRQRENAYRQKEIIVQNHKNYTQIILVANTKTQNSLSVESMKDLKKAFEDAKTDPDCHAVLLSSAGSYFCTGIDLSPLVGLEKNKAACEIASSMYDLVLTLAFFTKPVVAAVNGITVGLGVSLLTYCDVILASDKATFYLPARKIGYVSEGGAALTIPQVIANSDAADKFLQGHRLTAHEARQCGLVSKVFWPKSLMYNAKCQLEIIAQQPIQAMEAAKSIVRCHLWGNVKAHMDLERIGLVKLWLLQQCQENIRIVLTNGWIED